MEERQLTCICFRKESKSLLRAATACFTCGVNDLVSFIIFFNTGEVIVIVAMLQLCYFFLGISGTANITCIGVCTLVIALRLCCSCPSVHMSVCITEIFAGCFYIVNRCKGTFSVANFKSIGLQRKFCIIDFIVVNNSSTVIHI